MSKIDSLSLHKALSVIVVHSNILNTVHLLRFEMSAANVKKNLKSPSQMRNTILKYDIGTFKFVNWTSRKPENLPYFALRVYLPLQVQLVSHILSGLVDHNQLTEPFQ